MQCAVSQRPTVTALTTATKVRRVLQAVANTNTPHRLCKQVGSVAKRGLSSLSVSALICTDVSVYLVTSSRNTPQHHITTRQTARINPQPFSINLSQNGHDSKFEALTPTSTKPCLIRRDAVQAGRNVTAPESLFIDCQARSLFHISTSFSRYNGVSLYALNPLNTKREETGLGGAARGTGRITGPDPPILPSAAYSQLYTSYHATLFTSQYLVSNRPLPEGRAGTDWYPSEH